MVETTDIVEESKQVKRKQILDRFRHTDVMGEIFKYFTQRQRISMQGLNKRMYNLKVPTFV